MRTNALADNLRVEKVLEAVLTPGLRLCGRIAMSSSVQDTSTSRGLNERDRRWISCALLLLQIVIAVVAIRLVLLGSRESIAMLFGRGVPVWLVWLVRGNSLITLGVLATMLAAVVQITWPVKREQRSFVAWAACWGLFNVVLIWFLLHLANRVDSLISLTIGRRILVSAWPAGPAGWFVTHAFPILWLVAGYGVAQALDKGLGSSLWKRRTLHMFFGMGLAVLLLEHLEPVVSRGVAYVGAFDWVEDASLATTVHLFTLYGLLWSLPLLIWLGLGFVMFRRARRRIRLYPAHTKCRQCGYELRGDLEHGCPECGWRRS